MGVIKVQNIEGEGRRTEVESSQIRSVGFDAEKNEMEIEFKPGSIYKYDNVTQELFDEFMRAESKGKFFGQAIKSNSEKYPFTKIRGTDKQVQRAEESP